MNTYKDSIKYTGFSGPLDDEIRPDVILTCSRSDIYDILRYITFAVEQSENIGFIRDGVYLYDALDKVLKKHLEMVESPDDC